MRVSTLFKEYIWFLNTIQKQDALLFAASDWNYMNVPKGIFFNPNRLNMMISRAKIKVPIFVSHPMIQMIKKTSKILNNYFDENP